MAIRKIEIKEIKDPLIREMGDMRPWEIGQVVTEGSYQGHYLMRTASTDQFEVMDLSDPSEDSCWTRKVDKIKVKLVKGINLNITSSLY